MSVVGNESRMLSARRRLLALSVALAVVGISISCRKEADTVSEPFSILTRLGLLPSLNAVIAAAEPGDTVVIEEWQALAAIDEEFAVDEERAIASDRLPKDYVMDPIRLEVEGKLEKRVLELDLLLQARYPDRGMTSASVGPGSSWDARRDLDDFATWTAQAKATLESLRP